jgi:hypothetical protein
MVEYKSLLFSFPFFLICSIKASNEDHKEDNVATDQSDIVASYQKKACHLEYRGKIVYWLLRRLLTLKLAESAVFAFEEESYRFLLSETGLYQLVSN